MAVKRKTMQTPSEQVENIGPQELFEKAAAIIRDKLYEEESFLLSELFAGYYWRRIPIKVRLKFGHYFNARYEELDVTFDGILSSNQAVYHKNIREKKEEVL